VCYLKHICSSGISAEGGDAAPAERRQTRVVEEFGSVRIEGRSNSSSLIPFPVSIYRSGDDTSDTVIFKRVPMGANVYNRGTRAGYSR
jgi:hypothetical protein